MTVWPGAWPSHELSESRRRLKDLLALLRSRAQEEDEDARNALSKLVIVLACGHLEFTFTESFCELTKSQSSPKVAGFVREDFKHGLNPDKSNLLKKLNKLDKGLASNFEIYLEDPTSTRSENLSTLVNKRNEIAHGKDAGAKTVTAIKLAEFALEFSEWILGTLSPV